MLRPIAIRCLLALSGAVVALPALAQQQPVAQSRGVIELMNQIETMNADLNRLRGQLEVLNNSLENAQRRQRDMYLDLDTRVRRLEGGGDAAQKSSADLEARIKKLEQQLTDLEGQAKRGESTATPAPAAAQATPNTARESAAAAAAAPTAETSPIRRAYESAFAQYRSGDYQGAIAAFEAFVKRYPHDALAANAQYWIGDCWFNLRDFRAAAAAQQALIANYSDSSKVPDAMLNLASAQLALGDSATAKKTLEELIAKFPQHDAADKARQRVSKLK